MRILYFHQHFSTPHGAAGIRSYEMARRLVGSGHNVTMVCGSYGIGKTGLTGPFKKGRRRGSVDGIDVIEFDLSYSNKHSFLKRSWLFVKFALASVRIALTAKYDLAFATSTPLTAGIPGIAARWLRRKPFVFEVRDLWPELPREMGVITNPIVLLLMYLLEWLSYRSANRCIGLSPGIVDGISRLGVARERIAMISNGCDIEIFQSPNVLAWRPESVPKEALMAIFTGTHGQANGLSAVLDAAVVLKCRGRNDVRLVLVGDGKLKYELVERANRDGLDNVVFCDPVSKGQLAGLMASADIGIQCLANVPAFYFGTSPNKFFDYLAAGLPVLNNYPGWVANLITEADCGFVVPASDPEAFADALCRASDDRAKLDIMRANAMRLAKERFDRRMLANEWVDWVVYGNLSDCR